MVHGKHETRHSNRERDEVKISEERVLRTAQRAAQSRAAISHTAPTTNRIANHKDIAGVWFFLEVQR